MQSERHMCCRNVNIRTSTHGIQFNLWFEETLNCKHLNLTTGAVPYYLWLLPLVVLKCKTQWQIRKHNNKTENTTTNQKTHCKPEKNNCKSEQKKMQMKKQLQIRTKKNANEKTTANQKTVANLKIQPQVRNHNNKSENTTTYLEIQQQIRKHNRKSENTTANHNILTKTEKVGAFKICN